MDLGIERQFAFLPIAATGAVVGRRGWVLVLHPDLLRLWIELEDGLSSEGEGLGWAWEPYLVEQVGQRAIEGAGVQRVVFVERVAAHRVALGAHGVEQR